MSRWAKHVCYCCMQPINALLIAIAAAVPNPICCMQHTILLFSHNLHAIYGGLCNITCNLRCAVVRIVPVVALVVAFLLSIIHILLLLLLLLTVATNMFRFLIAAISRLTASFMPTQRFTRSFGHFFFSSLRLLLPRSAHPACFLKFQLFNRN